MCLVDSDNLVKVKTGKDAKRALNAYKLRVGSHVSHIFTTDEVEERNRIKKEVEGHISELDEKIDRQKRIRVFEM